KQVEQFKQEGFLPHSKWAPVQAVNESNMLQAGEYLFQAQCMSCHTVDGWRTNRAMAQRIPGWTKDGIAKYVSNLHEARSFMPPFAGNEKELEALAAYLEKVGTPKNGLQGQAQKGE
ncbi:MAG: c-type cytochrome, partial [Clostridia bacterium]